MKAAGRAAVAAAAVAAMMMPLAAAAADQDDALRLAQRVASPGIGRAAVMLHALPREMPAGVPLPQATLLGSVAQDAAAGMNGEMHVVARPLTLYYDARGERAAVLRAYESVLRSAGWKQASQDRMFPGPRGGFTMQMPRIDAWCSPKKQLAVAIAIPTGDPAALDVHVNTQAGGVQIECGDAPQSMLDAFPKSPLPAFTAPSGVTFEASGPASDGTTTGARIESSLGLATVFAGLASQLRDAGWAAAAVAATPSLRSQTFTKTVDGKAWVALLAVHTLDESHYVALADVSSH